MPDYDFPDYQHLGTDLSVEPDLDEDERLVVGVDCLLQDILHSWQQPTGLADGTREGAEWGEDIKSWLGVGMTTAKLFALKVHLETQAKRDDRVTDCQVAITVTDGGLMTIKGSVSAGGPPFPFSVRTRLSTVGDLFIERLDA
jgi:hypothetical protein